MFAVDLPPSQKSRDYGKAGRTANIKGNLHMCNAVKTPRKTITRMACEFNFPAAQQKVKK